MPVGQILGAGLSAYSTNRQNKKSRRWSEKMYGIQKQDNIDFWKMQNAYNTPEMQMDRFKQAGLNPNLIYGSGSSGSGNASPIQKADVQKAQFKTPDFSGLSNVGSNAINTYFDYKIKSAQVDNLHADNTIKHEQALNIAADTLSKTMGTSNTEFDLGLKKELRSTSVDAARESLRQQTANTNRIINQEERDAIMHNYNILESVNKIIGMRISQANTRQQSLNLIAQRKGINSDNQVKALSAELARQGLSSNDPLYLRLIAQILGGHQPMDIKVTSDKHKPRNQKDYMRGYKKKKKNWLQSWMSD